MDINCKVNGYIYCKYTSMFNVDNFADPDLLAVFVGRPNPIYPPALECSKLFGFYRIYVKLSI